MLEIIAQTITEEATTVGSWILGGAGGGGIAVWLAKRVINGMQKRVDDHERRIREMEEVMRKMGREISEINGQLKEMVEMERLMMGKMMNRWSKE